MCQCISMGIQGFGGLKCLILDRDTQVGYFLIPCINTHSLVFTKHNYLHPFGSEKKKQTHFRSLHYKWEFKVLGGWKA